MALRQAFLILLCVTLCHQFVNGSTIEASTITVASTEATVPTVAEQTTEAPTMPAVSGTTAEATPKPMFPPDISIALNGSAVSNISQDPLNTQCLELYQNQLVGSSQTLVRDINDKLSTGVLCNVSNELSVRWNTAVLSKVGSTHQLSLYFLFRLPSPPHKTVDQIEQCAYEIFYYSLPVDNWLRVDQEPGCPTVNLTFTVFDSPGIEWCRSENAAAIGSISLLDIQNVPPKLIIPFIANVNITTGTLSVACATAYSEEMESHSQVRASDVNVELYHNRLCTEHQNSSKTGLGVIWKSAKIDPSSTNNTVVRVVLEMPGVRDILIRAHEHCGTDVINFYTDLTLWADGGPNFSPIGPCPKIDIWPFKLLDDGMAWCERLDEIDPQ